MRADKWLEANVSVGARRFFSWTATGSRSAPTTSGPRAMRSAASSCHTDDKPATVVAAGKADRVRLQLLCRGALPGASTCAWTRTRQCAIHWGRAARWRSAICSAQITSSSTSSVPKGPRRSATCSLRGSSRRRAWSLGRRPCWSASSRRSPHCLMVLAWPSTSSRRRSCTLLLPKGKQLTPDTLYPFSQANLAHAARILGTYGIDVEVVGIPAA